MKFLTLIYNRTDDFDGLHLDDFGKVEASNNFWMVKIQEFENISLEQVELLWSEDELRQFLDSNNVDYSVEYTDDKNRLIYLANRNTWEFLFNDQGELAMITSTTAYIMILEH